MSDVRDRCAYIRQLVCNPGQLLNAAQCPAGEIAHDKPQVQQPLQGGRVVGEPMCNDGIDPERFLPAQFVQLASTCVRGRASRFRVAAEAVRKRRNTGIEHIVLIEQLSEQA